MAQMNIAERYSTSKVEKDASWDETGHRECCVQVLQSQSSARNTIAGVLIPITLKILEPSDALVIEAISTQARSDAVPNLREIHDLPARISFYTREINEKQGRLALNKVGTPMGFIIWHGNGIYHLYISATHRRQGVGSLLLKFALAQINSEGVYLYTFQENEQAVTFYLKHGFHIANVGDGSGNEEGLPDYRLEKIMEHKEIP